MCSAGGTLRRRSARGVIGAAHPAEADELIHMPLSDRQIERYSRQILVAGGVAQERLLASRIALIGTAGEVEPALRYLVGAGVGRIGLHLVDQDSAVRDRLMALARALDSNVAIQSEEPLAAGPDLRLIIIGNIGNGKVLAALKSRSAELWNSAVVMVRLDPPARIAVLPHAGPPPAALEEDLFAPWSTLAPGGASGDNAGFVTMVAVTEVLKLLMQAPLPAESIMIEFDGYQTRSRRPAQERRA